MHQVVPDAPAAKTRGLRGLLRADEALAVALPPSAAATRRFLGARAEELALELNAPRRAVEHQIANHDIARLD